MLKEDARRVLRDYQSAEAREEEDHLNLSPAAIRKALIHLNYRQRQLVDLVYLQGMTIREAAQKLEISPQPAGRTLRRARLRMEKELSSRVEAHSKARRTIQLDSL